MDVELISQIIVALFLITYGIVIRLKPNLFYKLYCKIFPPHARSQSKVEVLDSIRVGSNFTILIGIIYFIVVVFS